MMKIKNISLKDNILIPNFNGMKPRNYAVTAKYFDKDQPVPTKRIDYQSEISIIPKENGWSLSLAKDSFWFNGHEADLISEEIANELSKTIYPVQADINQKGAFERITNFEYIVNSRWHRNKLKATEKYNTTDIAKSFYSTFENTLKNRNVFEKSMQHDLFWNLLFHPKYINYGNDHSVKTDLYLSVVPYEHPIQFTGKQTINTEITNYHSVEVRFKSDEMKAHDYFVSKHDNAESKYDVFMKLNVYFDLDAYHLFPMHTRAYFEVYSKDSEGKEIPIKRVEFSQYQQGTENNKTVLSEKKNFLEADEQEADTQVYKTYEGKSYTYLEWKKFEEEQYKIYKEKKSKKGFWDFLG